MTDPSDSVRKEPPEMTTHEQTLAPPDSDVLPEHPTPEWREEQAERARLAREREAREEEENRRATKERLAALIADLERKGSKAVDPDLDDPDASEKVGQDYTDEVQIRASRARWWTSIDDAHVRDLAVYTISDVEDPLAQAKIQRYVDSLRPTRNSAGRPSKVIALKLNAIVSGSVGAGKTSLALAAGHAAVEKGLTVQIVSHARYLAMLRKGGQPAGMTRDQVRYRFRSPQFSQLLILDDFGAEYDVPGETGDRPPRPIWQEDATETLELVSDRLNSGLATIFTTNLTSAQVKAMFGDRTFSRIGKSAVGVPIVGEDRRKPLEW